MPIKCIYHECWQLFTRSDSFVCTKKFTFIATGFIICLLAVRKSYFIRDEIHWNKVSCSRRPMSMWHASYRPTKAQRTQQTTKKTQGKYGQRKKYSLGNNWWCHRNEQINLSPAQISIEYISIEMNGWQRLNASSRAVEKKQQPTDTQSKRVLSSCSDEHLSLIWTRDQMQEVEFFSLKIPI